MEFRRLEFRDFLPCFANRLRALEKSPNAFLTTLDEERARGEAHYKRLLSSQSDDNVIFGAVDGREVVGTIGIYQEDKPKNKHKANIWGMYVDEHRRREGIAGQLLDLSIAHARENMEVTAIYLSAESSNKAAKLLYETRGFRIWGTEPQAMRSGDEVFEEDHMVLEL